MGLGPHFPNQQSGGCWIRTSVGISRQVYSLLPLATRATLQRSGPWPREEYCPLFTARVQSSVGSHILEPHRDPTRRNPAPARAPVHRRPKIRHRTNIGRRSCQRPRGPKIRLAPNARRRRRQTRRGPKIRLAPNARRRRRQTRRGPKIRLAPNARRRRRQRRRGPKMGLGPHFPNQHRAGDGT